MGSHPINLAIRFLLELSALASFGIWGWQYGLKEDRWLAWMLVLALPIVAAAIWGIFNVPGDPSRSGNAPIVVPGFIRLAIELIFFALAVWALQSYGNLRLSWTMAIIVIIHYMVSYDRVLWLIKQ